MKENRQFQEMQSAARKKLTERSPETVAENGNLNYDPRKQEFVFETFGREVHVSYPDFCIEESLDMWHHLTILQYMDEADGHPLSEKWMALSEFRDGGMIRGSSFDRENDLIIKNSIGKADEKTVLEAAKVVGGKGIAGKADLSILFWFMPCFPFCLNLWFEDEEFPASGKVLCDQAAEHYLKVEAAGTMAGHLLRMLEKEIKRIRNKN